MRNVFDQYGQPENRLSHALATCLHEDRAFLKEFLAWAGAPPRTGKSAIRVIEQRMPFALVDAADERRGLPDLWLYDEDGWCLIVEAKIAASLTLDQLRRHQRTAERAGFEYPAGLTLTLDEPTLSVPASWSRRRWRDLYALVQRRARGSWPTRLSEYMEICESRLPEDE